MNNFSLGLIVRGAWQASEDGLSRGDYNEDPKEKFANNISYFVSAQARVKIIGKMGVRGGLRPGHMP